jgi:hypothetical protein
MRAFSQWRETAAVIINIGDVGYICDVDDVHLIHAPAIPGEEAVARATRQPAKTPKTAAEAEP